MKRSLLFFILLLTCSVAFAAGGKCGENVKWDLNKKGVLTISGTGDMQDNIQNNMVYKSPWYEHRASITSIIINEGVTSIGYGAFKDCSSLISVTIPNSVTSIGQFAFYDCSNLTSLTIPNSVTFIGSCAFWGCNGMTSLEIPNSVTNIEDGAFKYCRGLKTPIYNAHCFVYMPPSYTGTYTIPEGIEQIVGCAFFACSNLTSIEIPNSVTSIGGLAFTDCKNLTTLAIPNSVTTIGRCAFENCSNLKSVVIPTGVTSIKEETFKNCSNLTSVTIPNSVTSIGRYAFEKCESLTSLTLPNSVNSVGDAAFLISGLKELRYPKGLDVSKTNIPSSTKLIAYERPAYPPLLAIVDGSLSFTDDSRNNRIDAGEKCNVRFKIANKGKGEAKDCEARVQLSGSKAGITVQSVQLPTIAPGKTYEVVIPIASTINTQDGQVTLSIEVNEPNGFGVAPFDLSVATKAYEPPYLQIVDYNITSNSGKIRKMEPFTLTFNLQNTKYGTAEDVKVKINMPNNIYIVEGEKEMSYHQIRSGEVVKVQLSLLANNNYSTTNIPISIDVKERYGKFAENKQLDIALNQTAKSTVNIAAKDEPQQERKEIQLAMMTSEVDRNIPVSKTKNPNTFVLIIANEHYQQVASVPFALNDGNIFREYCIKTLGIGEKHIHYVADATGNQIKSHINWLANITETWDDAQIIVYYAGHGIPDEASKSAYLLPVDGSGTDVTTGYKLDDLYATLGNMPASQITVFMDACFSGSKREQGMLASARGVALKTKSGVPQGKMVVFSAAQGDETAYPNREQQHGLFTYYLLKKLQETEGNVGLKDLGDYVTKQVSQQSLLLNSKKQTPCVTPSAEVGTDWENWKLK